jgi:hypothetical protein
MARNEDDVGVTVDECEAKAATANALLVVGDGLKKYYSDGSNGLWVPRSVIHDDSEVFEKGDTGTLVLKTWWAEDRGIS